MQKESILHTQVRVGKLISHDAYSISPVPWRGVTVHPRSDDPDAAAALLDRHARELRSYLRSGAASAKL